MIQKDNEVTNHSITVFLNCTKDEGNASDFKPEIKHCLYFVTGEPPDLQLTIRLRNLKREDGGLWYVTISNDVGSDVKYIHVSITVVSDENASKGEYATVKTLKCLNTFLLNYKFEHIIFSNNCLEVMFFIYVWNSTSLTYHYSLVNCHAR